ncbi:hypothetical protein [Streptomyces sp. rh34]|uniref:hypothetical protein n=1 Tax=Streptomyces sp. rh34 TaxID=2034272 RepID=UPI000BF12F4E|nr:hypothetical protein [Streptomyces sp. rh34]
MNEESIPLEDFLDTLNRLQADFEQRLGGIERKALPTSLADAHVQEHPSRSAWTQGHGYRSLGLEAIWTSPRTSSDERSIGQRDPISSRHLETLCD